MGQPGYLQREGCRFLRDIAAAVTCFGDVGDVATAIPFVGGAVNAHLQADFALQAAFRGEVHDDEPARPYFDFLQQVAG